MSDSPILVSACLAGVRCRYDGESNPFEPVLELMRSGRALPFCPEVFGGLTIPRPPCELQVGRAFDVEGHDLTEAFRRGAEEGVLLAQMAGCTEAILKSRSPSCGCGVIYDGSFSGNKVPGDGVFAAMLRERGFHLRTEEDFPSR